MKRSSAIKCLLFTLISLITFTVCNAGPVFKSAVIENGSGILNAPQGKGKKGKIKKTMSAEKAQKKQAAKEEKLKRDSEKYIKENRKRSIEIQTPEVQERMKQNIKDANARYKAKKKNSASRTKKAGRKYR